MNSDKLGFSHFIRNIFTRKNIYFNYVATALELTLDTLPQAEPVAQMKVNPTN